MGPADLSDMLESLSGLAPSDDRILVGARSADDAGVFLLDGAGQPGLADGAAGSSAGCALVATVDLITPVCDDPYRFGRVAAANSMSDVFAMGGEMLFALNLCCFPEDAAPGSVFGAILQGAIDAVDEAGGVVLGGHSVADRELKYGLAVIGRADPKRILVNSGARPGQRLVLTKRLGSGALINALRRGTLDEQGFEPVLASMERLNASAAGIALEHGATACTDVTGFGLVNHAIEVARASSVGIRIDFDRLPVFPGFFEAIAAGISTRGTDKNRSAARQFEDEAGLTEEQQELLFDPQTSGGLLIAIAGERVAALIDALVAAGDAAAEIGEVVAGPAWVTVR